MGLKEEIIRIRKQKKLRIVDIHNKLRDLFGDKSISYRTLLRIEKGETFGRDGSLYQICIALGVTLRDIKGEVKETVSSTDLTPRLERKGRFIYNEKTFAEIISGSQKSYRISELVLKYKGKTKIEQNPNGGDLIIYTLSGKICCVLEDKDKHMVQRDDCFIFNASVPHYFENVLRRRSRCIIIEMKKAS